MIELNQNRISHAFLNSLRDQLRIGADWIISHDLDTLAVLSGKFGKVIPVVFTVRIFNRNDFRKLIKQLDVVSTKFFWRVGFAFKVVIFGVVVVEVRSRRIKSNRNFLTGGVAGLNNRVM